MKKIYKFIFIIAILLVTLSAGREAIQASATSGFLLSEKVYLGGFSVGIDTLSEGLYVDELATITTENGLVTPLKDKGIDEGDILLKVNGNTVSSKADVSKSIKPKRTNYLELLDDKKEKFIVECTPIFDDKSQSYLLGLYLSDSIEGIGTVTFIRSDGRFSALGHPIANDKGKAVATNNAKIFKCTIDSVTPSKKDFPGKINGNFSIDEAIGRVIKNTDFGIYGVMNGDEYKKRTIQTQSRLLISTGKAKIYTTIVDNKPDYYDIEILSLSMQPRVKEKGMLIKVTDPRLLAIGGIVQGMSGSPIIQNDKLVGAVTHVLIEDTTKGYGIYSDFLFDISNEE